MLQKKKMQKQANYQLLMLQQIMIIKKRITNYLNYHLLRIILYSLVTQKSLV